MNIVNNVHPLRPVAKLEASFLKRLICSCLETNQRIYLSAITDPKTGRVDSDVERQLGFMILG